MPILQVLVEGIEDFPLRDGACCGSRPVRVQVQPVLEKDGQELGHLGELIEGEQASDGSVSFDASGCLREIVIDPAYALRFMVYRQVDEIALAQCRIKVSDLARQRSWRLLLAEYDPDVDFFFNTRNADEALYGTDGVAEQADDFDPIVRRPSFLRLRVDVPDGSIEQQVCPDFVPHMRRPKGSRKRVLMITRGTRGDVQPFIALARGLCLPPYNCEVIIATEIDNKEFVKKGRVGLPEGSLLFRPLGGNTMAYTSRAFVNKVMWSGQHADLLQSVYFSMQEVTFFGSEGTCFFWAYEENPDFVVFGMTFTNIAMIISECLEIPIVGFILQPARAIESRHHTFDAYDELLQPARQLVNDTEFNIFLTHVMEKSGFTGASLNDLRHSRGLRRTPPAVQSEDSHYMECFEQGVPMVCPIPGVIVKDKPKHLQFTDFLFLNTGKEEISQEVQAFIDTAHKEHRRVGVIAFSSMPVGMRTLLDISFHILKRCRAQSDNPDERTGPAILLMAAGQEKVEAPTEVQKATAARFEKANRLLVLSRGQPFHALFPKLDFAILHGGLGVTSEALIAGIPVVTSGIQLLDQRWWGARMEELGVGSAGVPVERLSSLGIASCELRVVELVNQAIDLRPLTDSGDVPWPRRAKEVQREILANRDGDADGVEINSKAVYDGGIAKRAVLEDTYGDFDGPFRRCRGFVLQCGCIASCCETILACLLCAGLPALFFFFMRWFESCMHCGPCRYRARIRELRKENEELSDSDVEAGLVAE
eukprot:CAMPEP_0178392168 /NCGR_PEP_ID=MMETSP0689_2-20121128/11539_1 /TAXON_ID=160604 /ORGANISM="Amphidinium massartii, Strain CS-259" /LENGTH=763 /DNA_ID=CAMNT_0020012733 /DNA_START=61 /DNA_END=2352 /DNA_ORIENTATION=-